MGTAIAKALLRAGSSPNEVSGSVRRQESIERIRRELPGIYVSTNNSEVVKGADVIILSVKPRQVMDALRSLEHSLNPNQLLISVVAGVPTRVLESMTPCRVVRAMPNMGIIIERGVTAVSPGSRTTGDDLDFVCSLFRAMGKCYLVDEQYMNAITAISGSGPAFIALIVEALWESGLLVGLPTDLSWRLVLDTIESSLELLRVKKPWEVVEEVTTPAGVTISGLKVAESRGLRGIIMEMIETTNNRGIEIGRALLRELGYEGA